MRTALLLGLSLVVYVAAMVVGLRALRDRVDPQAELIREGRAVFAEHCASCHGTRFDGQSNPRVPSEVAARNRPPFDPALHTWRLSDTLLIGIARSDVPQGAPVGLPIRMPDQRNILTWSEIEAVLAYVDLVRPERARRFKLDDTPP